jgi:glycine/D-amino acid oxidase-like deaminating enzyme
VRIAVVGGGLQGCAVALELARRGHAVELFDEQPNLMTGASRNSEGKIHLGYVYAADSSLRTARLMCRGAAAFGPLLRRWIGDAYDEISVSQPFRYAVHRDSLLDGDALATTYHAISLLVREAFERPWEGHDPDHDWAHLRRLERDETSAYTDDVTAVFETAEVAIDTEELADAMAKAVLATDGILVRTWSRVMSAEPSTRRLTVLDESRGLRLTGRFDHVVNCAWNGRLTIDASAGVSPPAAWTFRMKYFARVFAPVGAETPPSTTVVLGAFGDIVDFGGGNFYLSWYPACRLGWSSALSPPNWPSALVAHEARRRTSQIIDGLAAVAPSVASFQGTIADATVGGGIIYAQGSTDVSDPRSGFHERYDVGPRSFGGYHTVDTGKMTLAPLFALDVADRIDGTGHD